jgi:nucleoside-diphosphate-sugar epimerase
MSFNETIFMTGFPGFIAGRLVERLATPESQFFLLVQPAFVDKAKEDVQLIASKCRVPLENFVLFEGDITHETLGLSEDDLDVVRAETTDVFHLAAIYDLGVKREPAFRVNVDGTKHVNDLVRSMANLHRYNYISTCYVAGKRRGAILESDLAHDAGFRNFYEETKYLAEVEVENLKEEFPVTIFRPSVVLGDSKTGETAKYDGIYYVIFYYKKAASLLRFVNVGNKNVKLNLVPVDFVVEGIATLSKDPKAVGKTIALADPDPLSTAAICDSITEALTGKKTLMTPPASVVEWSLNLGFSPAITGLPHYGVPYFFLEQTYDTRDSESLLGAHGIACPRFSDYAGNLVKFVNEHPKLD